MPPGRDLSRQHRCRPYGTPWCTHVAHSGPPAPRTRRFHLDCSGARPWTGSPCAADRPARDLLLTLDGTVQVLSRHDECRSELLTLYRSDAFDHTLIIPRSTCS